MELSQMAAEVFAHDVQPTANTFLATIEDLAKHLTERGLLQPNEVVLTRYQPQDRRVLQIINNQHGPNGQDLGPELMRWDVYGGSQKSRQVLVKKTVSVADNIANTEVSYPSTINGLAEDILEGMRTLTCNHPKRDAISEAIIRYFQNIEEHPGPHTLRLQQAEHAAQITGFQAAASSPARDM